MLNLKQLRELSYNAEQKRLAGDKEWEHISLQPATVVVILDIIELYEKEIELCIARGTNKIRCRVALEKGKKKLESV